MHNYTNPSEKQDLSHVEAQLTKGKKYYDDQGWEIKAPISDTAVIGLLLRRTKGSKDAANTPRTIVIRYLGYRRTLAKNSPIALQV